MGPFPGAVQRTAAPGRVVSADLNPAQRAAVRYDSGPLLVLAGAGSGKTRVITRKIAHLIQRRGVEPGHVVAVTFTNKAAREMKSRVTTLMGKAGVRGLTVSTFHRLGLSILRQHHHQLDLRPGFSLLDPADSLLAVRELMREELGADGDLAERVRQRISTWKNDGIDEPRNRDADDPLDAAAARVYPAYERQIRAYNAVDLDDLLLLPVKLFRHDRKSLKLWRGRIRYLLVDEYQDTNTAQYELVKLLMGDGDGLTVVGDDDQSIYAWRGARPQNLSLLKTDFPKLKVIKLEQNYRSLNRILGAANALIGHNPRSFDKKLWSAYGHGEPIQVLVAKNEVHEAERVASSLLHHKFQNRSNYRDYAILYRGNHQARIFEQSLREMRIPYRVSGGISFFDRTEIKDVLAYLRLITNIDDDTAFLRVVNVPRRGIGAGTLEKLGALAAEQRSSLLRASTSIEVRARLRAQQWGGVENFASGILEASERADADAPMSLIEDMLKEMDYTTWLRDTAASPEAADQRIANVAELLDWIRGIHRNDPDQTLTDLLRAVILAGMLDRDEDEAADDDRVSLMTLHAAKGLEFPYVYIVGVEEDQLPHHNSIRMDTVEEERRLFYVGVTRAQRRLWLSWSRQRRRFGETVDCAPSRFLEELPGQDLDWGSGSPDQTGVGEAHLATIRDLLA